MSEDIEQLKELWKQSKWYSERGGKKVGELYEEIRSRGGSEGDPKDYCDNIREACKNIEKAFDGVERVEIVSEKKG